MTAVQTAATWPGVTVVSMSWGMTEFSNESSYDSNFTTPGVTCIASSGDTGPVNWPACSPDVLSVGGTSLYATSSGVYESESGWASSGGGLSQYETEPAFQESAQKTGFRSTPDVSFVANPNTGVSMYDIPPRQHYGPGNMGANRRHQRWCTRLGRHHRDRERGPRHRRFGAADRRDAAFANAICCTQVRLP